MYKSLKSNRFSLVLSQSHFPLFSYNHLLLHKEELELGSQIDSVSSPSREWLNQAVLSKNLAKTNETIAESLMRIFNDGPLVSFNGSPTVSPITAASCAGVPFPYTIAGSPTVNLPASINFLALSQAPPVLLAEIAI